MATPTRRIPPHILADDLEALTNLKAIQSYTPFNTAYSAQNGGLHLAAVTNLQNAEVLAEAAYKAARDNAAAAEWALHEFILGARKQILAQFGPDSNEAQSLGLKKKSEYKKPATRNAAKGTKS